MTRLAPRGHTADSREILMEPWATLEPGDVQPGMPEMACAEPMPPSVPTRRHRRTHSTRLGRQVRHLAGIYRLNRINRGVLAALVLTFITPLPF